ncbi:MULTISPECIES: fatty acid desaturase [Nostocales]|uniref:Fatty acid desaturase n=1 Tax=Dolichospermum flos-aquae UHCC 0037 TaxID=2590026 RepID=A0ACC7S8Z5_DOLFA|nr:MULTISPECIES: fatty acid desaturase [Nostocales]MBO1067340.1 fatty acid desaturase [Anabaena sp. 54]MTJ44992.1 fatty acid desaturase [Dolichospermum flos-aquae UHCC 0037]
MKEFTIPKPAEQVIPQASNLFKAGLFVSLMFGSFYTAQITANQLDVYFSLSQNPVYLVLKWSVIILLAIFNCMLLTGIGVVAHEGIHGILVKNRFWNELLGGLLSSLVMTLPFYANRQFHLTHHRYTHQSGLDPEEALHNHSFIVAFVFGGLIALYQHYKIVATNLSGFGSNNWKQGLRGLKDLGFIGFSLAFYLYLLPFLGMSLWYTFVPTLLFVPLVYSYRSLCDHYAFVPALSPAELKNSEPIVSTDEEIQDPTYNKYQVDSWVVLTNPLMNWWWSHINYQQVHHRYPYLSHHYLPQIYEVTKHEQPYAVAKGYWRCLLYNSKLKYYSKPEEIEPFIIQPSA